MTRTRRTDDRLRPIEDCSVWDGYRGDQATAWRLAKLARPGPPIEEYATVCGVCGQWWGWSPLLGWVRKLKAGMALAGCPRCKKRGKRKKQKRLRKALAS